MNRKTLRILTLAAWLETKPPSGGGRTAVAGSPESTNALEMKELNR